MPGPNDNHLYAQNPTPEMRARGVREYNTGRKWYEPFQPDPNSPSERFSKSALDSLRSLVTRSMSAPTKPGFGVSEMGDLPVPNAAIDPIDYGGPRIVPMPPDSFRRPTTNVAIPQMGPSSNTTGVVDGNKAPWNYQEIPGGWMERTPGGTGMEGQEWTLSGTAERNAPKVPALRPLEELFRIASGKVATAPGAQEMALYELGQRGAGSEGMERLKIDAPMREQEIAGQYGVMGQQAQGAGNLAVEQTRQQGMKDQSQNMLQLYQMLLGNGGGGQGSNIAGMTMPSRTGGGGIRFQEQQRPGNPLLRDVTAARMALEAARRSNWIGDPMEETNVQQADAQYRAALGQVFSQDQADSDIKEVAIEIATDPDLSDLPLSQLLEHPKFNQSWDANALSDEDLTNLDRLLNYARGAAGTGF